MRTAYQIRARESMPEPPTRDPKYLKFLRTQPSTVCHHAGSEHNPLEAEHTRNRGRAISQKADDHDAIPLCVWCHIIRVHSYHAYSLSREAAWAASHCIDLPSLRTTYLTMYRAANRLPGDCVAECGE